MNPGDRPRSDSGHAPSILVSVDLEKTLLRKVGEAVGRFKMIRDGDRVAVALSGGKDSATLLEVLLLLQKRAPIDFSVCAFTVEQGKFLSPIEPMKSWPRYISPQTRRFQSALISRHMDGSLQMKQPGD